MESLTEAWLDRVLDRSPAQPLFRRRSRGRLVVLAYHDVIDVGRFRGQLEYLRRTMNVVGPDDAVRAIRGDRSLAPHAVLITFDDGDRSVYDVGLPVLRDLGLPAVVFVVAGLIGTESPFWWYEADRLVRLGGRPSDDPDGSAAAVVRRLKESPDADRLTALAELRRSAGDRMVRTRQLQVSELLELERAGIEIGNHTDSHPCLDRCDEGKVVHEVVRAHERLTGMLGHPPRLFAFPNGNHDPRVPPVLSSLGYEAAFLFDHRIGRTPARDPYQVSRLRVNSTTSLDRFRGILSGMHPFIHHALGRR
jgi:peptidoglycan/xylan/chitin deacetylase (PgdA/CDA1 family)